MYRDRLHKQPTSEELQLVPLMGKRVKRRVIF